MKFQITQPFLVRALNFGAEIGRKSFEVFVITIEIHVSLTASEILVVRSLLPPSK